MPSLCRQKRDAQVEAVWVAGGLVEDTCELVQPVEVLECESSHEDSTRVWGKECGALWVRSEKVPDRLGEYDYPHAERVPVFNEQVFLLREKPDERACREEVTL